MEDDDELDDYSDLALEEPYEPEDVEPLSEEGDVSETFSRESLPQEGQDFLDFVEGAGKVGRYAMQEYNRPAPPQQQRPVPQQRQFNPPPPRSRQQQELLFYASRGDKRAQNAYLDTLVRDHFVETSAALDEHRTSPQFTPQQLQRIQGLNNQLSTLDEQLARGQIRQPQYDQAAGSLQRMINSVRPRRMPPEQKPWPDEQGVGKQWRNEGGDIVTRDEKGKVTTVTSYAKTPEGMEQNYFQTAYKEALKLKKSTKGANGFSKDVPLSPDEAAAYAHKATDEWLKRMNQRKVMMRERGRDQAAAAIVMVRAESGGAPDERGQRRAEDLYLEKFPNTEVAQAIRAKRGESQPGGQSNGTLRPQGEMNAKTAQAEMDKIKRDFPTGDIKDPKVRARVMFLHGLGAR